MVQNKASNPMFFKRERELTTDKEQIRTGDTRVSTARFVMPITDVPANDTWRASIGTPHILYVFVLSLIQGRAGKGRAEADSFAMNNAKTANWRRKRKGITGVGLGDGGGAGEVAGAGGHGLALVVAVEGVGGVGLDGVWEEAESARLQRQAVGAGTAGVVQRRLQCLHAGVAPRHAPRRRSGGVGDADKDDQK
ncbi:hypothetical protein TIFTF001_032990 [Ficus carica]|uniref:Uncharacterized protein n=1 Tax=Ficus carica TaxID=3494 RepID=A0AA88DY30_FICCA|nr:hypothetical protein TIFTF001_032990 [Ficus carica]